MIEAATQALETMFFAIPDAVSAGVSAEAARPDGELIAASLAFQGSPGGRFGLLVSHPLARTLAANVIGCDEAELAPGQVTGVVGELTNMICGAALTRIEAEAGFDLAAPETIRVNPDEPAPAFPAAASSVCRLEFPEGALVAFLTFQDKA